MNSEAISANTHSVIANTPPQCAGGAMAPRGVSPVRASIGALMASPRCGPQTRDGTIRSSCAALPCTQVLLEEGRQLVERDEVGAVVEVHVARALHPVQF